VSVTPFELHFELKIELPLIALLQKFSDKLDKIKKFCKTRHVVLGLDCAPDVDMVFLREVTVWFRAEPTRKIPVWHILSQTVPLSTLVTVSVICDTWRTGARSQLTLINKCSPDENSAEADLNGRSPD